MDDLPCRSLMGRNERASLLIDCMDACKTRAAKLRTGFDAASLGTPFGSTTRTTQDESSVRNEESADPMSVADPLAASTADPFAAEPPLSPPAGQAVVPPAGSGWEPSSASSWDAVRARHRAAQDHRAAQESAAGGVHAAGSVQGGAQQGAAPHRATMQQPAAQDDFQPMTGERPRSSKNAYGDDVTVDR